MLKRFEMTDCKPAAVSISTETRLEVDKIKQATIEDVKIYQAIVESLIYLNTQIRLNIENACQTLSLFIMNSTSEATAAAKTTLRYLKRSKDLEITFRGSVSDEDLEAFTNADYADDRDTRKSTEVYVFKLYEGAIS